MLEASLIVVGGDSADKEIALQLPATIGRGRETTITVQHALVSRLHCEVYEREGRLFVRDLGSMNGTFVNNFRIQLEEPLLPGQLLTLGNITFRARYELADAALQEAGNGAPGRAGQGILKANDSPAKTKSAQPSPGSARSPSHGQSDREVPVKEQTTHRRKLVESRPSATPDFARPSTGAEPPKVAALADPPLKTGQFGLTSAIQQPTAAGPENSDVLAGFEFIATPEHSISVSALNFLPALGPAASFTGLSSCEIAGAGKMPAADFDTAELDVLVTDEHVIEKVEGDDSRLGSFLRQLPR